VVLAALALGRSPARRSAPPPPPASARAEAPRGAAAEAPASAVDPARIRDVFRFADEPAPATPSAAGSSAEASERLSTPAPGGPRLVGLVRRSGRLVAVLAEDGDVVLAGPGEVAAGVTILSVDEEGVRIRRADGREETLVLD